MFCLIRLKVSGEQKTTFGIIIIIIIQYSHNFHLPFLISSLTFPFLSISLPENWAAKEKGCWWGGEKLHDTFVQLIIYSLENREWRIN